MRKIYITSDTHFNHDMLVDIGDRPQGFNEKIFEELSKVGENDVLIHVGDICIGQDTQAHENYIIPLKCKKILVKGNHDKKSNNWYLDHGWDFVCESFVDRFFGKMVLFSHIPTLHHEYDLNIHGHFHNSKRGPHYDNVGVDPNEYFLIAIEEQRFQNYSLETILKKRK